MIGVQDGIRLILRFNRGILVCKNCRIWSGWSKNAMVTVQLDHRTDTQNSVRKCILPVCWTLLPLWRRGQSVISVALSRWLPHQKRDGEQTLPYSPAPISMDSILEPCKQVLNDQHTALYLYVRE